MILISFCAKHGDTWLCPAVEDDSLSFYMEISVGVLFPNDLMRAILTSGDAPDEDRLV